MNTTRLHFSVLWGVIVPFLLLAPANAEWKNENKYVVRVETANVPEAGSDNSGISIILIGENLTKTGKLKLETGADDQQRGRTDTFSFDRRDIRVGDHGRIVGVQLFWGDSDDDDDDWKYGKITVEYYVNPIQFIKSVFDRTGWLGDSPGAGYWDGEKHTSVTLWLPGVSDKPEVVSAAGKYRPELIGVTDITVLYPGTTRRFDRSSSKTAGIKIGNEIKKGFENITKLGMSTSTTASAEVSTGGPPGGPSGKSSVSTTINTSLENTNALRREAANSTESYTGTTIEDTSSVELKARDNEIKIIITEEWVNRTIPGRIKLAGKSVDFIKASQYYRKHKEEVFRAGSKKALEARLEELRKWFPQHLRQADVDSAMRNIPTAP